MIEQIVHDIAKQTSANETEIIELEAIFKRIVQESQHMGLPITQDRWLTMGVHLIAFFRRMKNGETLPAIESALFRELSPEMVELSSRILHEYGRTLKRMPDDTEVFLLAVHFETARKQWEQGG